jgi:hypothetical protein
VDGGEPRRRDHEDHEDHEPAELADDEREQSKLWLDDDPERAERDDERHRKHRSRSVEPYEPALGSDELADHGGSVGAERQ